MKLDAKELDHEFDKIRLNLDNVNTPNLSKIKEIIKRVHFADIKTDQQAFDNTGLAYYKLYLNSEGKQFSRSLLINYTIEPKHTGVVYGEFTQNTDKDGNKVIEFQPGKFNNYVRFLADVASRKVVYSDELESFVIVENHSYTLLDQPTFEIQYPVDNNKRISDFLEVIETIYSEIMQVRTHNYKIEPYIIAGIDWAYDCRQLKPVEKEEEQEQLFLAYYDVSFNDLNIEKAEEYMNMVASEEDSFHNLRLIHAYVLLGKMGLIPVQHAFILKDFGRTGKGLFMKTFPEVFEMNAVNFDNLMSGSIEASNEWLKFHGCDVSHANESGAINAKVMRYIRKIATQENVTGRTIGKDTVNFKIRSVLILDTNETVDIGQITANVSRTVKIAFKDRPEEETEQERFSIFEPYWDFIQPNGENSLEAGLAFLISSLNYLKEQGGKFIFRDTALKQYSAASQLTDTQEFLIQALSEQKYVLSNDDILKDLLWQDYRSENFRKKEVRKDMDIIGLEPNYPALIDGKTAKVVRVKDTKLFNKTCELLS